jgi:hypothetical protein
MREMSVTQQRYKAVLAVIADGRTVIGGWSVGSAKRCVPGWRGMRVTNRGSW